MWRFSRLLMQQFWIMLMMIKTVTKANPTPMIFAVSLRDICICELSAAAQFLTEKRSHISRQLGISLMLHMRSHTVERTDKIINVNMVFLFQ